MIFGDGGFNQYLFWHITQLLIFEIAFFSQGGAGCSDDQRVIQSPFGNPFMQFIYDLAKYICIRSSLRLLFLFRTVPLRKRSKKKAQRFTRISDQGSGTSSPRNAYFQFREFRKLSNALNDNFYSCLTIYPSLHHKIYL